MQGKLFIAVSPTDTGVQDTKPASHVMAGKNCNSSGETAKAAKMTELDDQLCGGKASYEARPVKAAGSWPCERLSRVVDTSEEQSHHVLWRDNRNCPAP